MKQPMKAERTLTVALNILNPDPVENKSNLEFHSRVKCGPLLTLFVNNPNPEEFNAFVATLSQRALDEFNDFARIKSPSPDSVLAGNVYDEPPEFEELDPSQLGNKGKPIDAAEIESSIEMLKQYLDADTIKPLLEALKALSAEPQNESCLMQVVNAFSELGLEQGAVLTYAPYVGALMYDDPFEHR